MFGARARQRQATETGGRQYSLLTLERQEGRKRAWTLPPFSFGDRTSAARGEPVEDAGPAPRALVEAREVILFVRRVETVVVRSDGRQLHAVEIPAPKGTPSDRKVMRLSDGTLIDAMPKAPAHPSWSWRSIDGWLKAKGSGAPIRHRPFREILGDGATKARRKAAEVLLRAQRACGVKP